MAPSNTPPCNAVYDGCNYYYLPWSKEKPCVCVESYWENIAFRLEPLNALLRIIDRAVRMTITLLSLVFFFPVVSYGPCFLGLEVASLTCFLLAVLISFSRRYASFPRISLMLSNRGGGSQSVIKKDLVNKLLSWLLFVLQKSKIAEVTYMIASNAPEVDRASSLFSLLDQLIADCR